MITNLKLEEFEQKYTKASKPYWRWKTSQGYMSVFDGDLQSKLSEHVDEEVQVEVTEKGTFKNITKLIDSNDLGVKVEKVIQDTVQVKKDTAKNTTMYTSYAKDIFCALYSTEKTKNLNADLVMEIAIDLVKQAKEAFE